MPKATQVVSGRTRLITSCAYSFVSFHPLCSFCSIKETPKHNLSSPRALETRKLLSTFLFLVCDLKAIAVQAKSPNSGALGNQRAEGLVGLLALGLRAYGHIPAFPFMSCREIWQDRWSIKYMSSLETRFELNHKYYSSVLVSVVH